MGSKMEGQAYVFQQVHIFQNNISKVTLLPKDINILTLLKNYKIILKTKSKPQDGLFKLQKLF